MFTACMHDVALVNAGINDAIVNAGINDATKVSK